MMRFPMVQGLIERRVLVNYRVDPTRLERILPRPLAPKLVRGYGIGGICLIRLKGIRPLQVPGPLGISSENAAHRIAVVLPDGTEGVYIPRRDTSSLLNWLVGGRLFPGVHHRSRFEVEEGDGRYAITLTDRTGEILLSVKAGSADALPAASAFRSLAEASAFFEAGVRGYSPAAAPGRLDSLELRTKEWSVTPLAVHEVFSGFFDERRRFPEGSVQFDSALLMRDIRHEWHAGAAIYVS